MREAALREQTLEHQVAVFGRCGGKQRPDVCDAPLVGLGEFCEFLHESGVLAEAAAGEMAGEMELSGAQTLYEMEEPLSCLGMHSPSEAGPWTARWLAACTSGLAGAGSNTLYWI